MALTGAGQPRLTSGDVIKGWVLGRLPQVPDCVPTGWALWRLSDIARLESGHTPSRLRPDYWQGDIPWISLHDSDALDGPSISRTAQTFGPLGLANSSARLLPAGTVVFSRTATVGKATLMAREMTTSQDFANYVCGEKVHGAYLVHLFRYMQPEWQRLKAGSTHNSIYMPVFRELEVLLPPVAEQRAIAEALGDVDELLASLDKLIAKKRDLKQAVMQQLLTGQTRLPGFTAKWARRRLGDVLKICHGRSQREVEVLDGPYPILATGGQIGTACRPLYDRPSVLIGRKGTINQPQYMATPFWTVDTLFYSAMKAENDARYFYYRFCLIDWMQFNEASGVPSLNSRTIESVEVECPPPDEQRSIAAVLSEVEDELEGLKLRREKTRALKEGMMQELLTGRTRLV